LFMRNVAHVQAVIVDDVDAALPLETARDRSGEAPTGAQLARTDGGSLFR